METQSDGVLTPRHVVLLAKAISSRDIKAIAEGYLDISHEEVVSLVVGQCDLDLGSTHYILSRHRSATHS